MNIATNKKYIFILKSYAILIFIYALFDILFGILPKFFPLPIKPTGLLSSFFIFTGLFLYMTPINIIVGYGLLRKRCWARYGVIAVMLTFIVYSFSQYLYLWKFCFYQKSLYIQFLLVVLTLFFFTRKSVKALFGEYRPFKFISWHGLLVALIILFSFFSIFFSIFMKIKYKIPLHGYAEKHQTTILKKPDLSKIPEKYLRHEILDTSLLTPKEFVMNRLFKKNHGWRVMFQSKGKISLGGMISLTNEFPHTDDEYEYFRKSFGPITKYDLDKYMRTNNWNPAIVIIRSTQRKIGRPIDTKEIHMNGTKGFWERRQEDEYFVGEFTLYKNEGDQSIDVAYIMFAKYFNENDIMTILSSIEFLKPEDPGQAQNHYKKGLMFYKQGNVLQAQIEFANAYMLSPENPDFIYMLAKSIFSKEIDNGNYVRDLLQDALRIKPNHQEARKLLREIELKLPKKTK